MTTVAAFAPLLLVEGTAGKFVSILPKVVILCLLASLFECLVVLPAHYLDFGSRRRKGSSRPRSGRAGRAAARIRYAIDAAFKRSAAGTCAHWT
jgi:HAE1 family hydrophobic/amphiphilic exporter-1